jgi:hypothetical protein
MKRRLQEIATTARPRERYDGREGDGCISDVRDDEGGYLDCNNTEVIDETIRKEEGRKLLT